ncbi:anti-sigma factor family protein [Streptomyces spongiae]|uniref:Zf-HC2 domain-containing protein n=1 Tax=Streptomyces spongiae TaxID=565072 RepID=A0A5N8XUE7_9ACTN|nr:zf-HC2 domain-containing protein [Streptomyces spongiae]MPY63017.1 zf-HC2 domain-containing protein [Streptomyces spongiae]
MSGSRPNPGERRVADQHLGDRLSALVDGELGHDSRERVLAHLATCTKCKAEADAQRRLKNVFAEAAPPSPSESFLARLQGLPGGGDLDGGGSPLSGGGFGGRLPGPGGGPGLPGDPRVAGGPGVFGVRGEPFGYVPSGPHAGVLSPSEERGLFGGRGVAGGRGFFGDRGMPGGGRGFFGDRSPSSGRGFFGDRGPGLPGDRGPVENPEFAGADGSGLAEGADSVGPVADGGITDAPAVTGDRGFRIHHVGRHDAERQASRGMRFAFVAAGAVSLAAIALGGMSTGVPADTTEARGGSGSGSNVTPMRAPGSGTTGVPESQRRRGSVAPLLGQGQGTLGEAPVAPTEVSAPLLPGVPAPAGQGQQSAHPLTAPVLAGAAAMSPLIRPLASSSHILSAEWPTTPELVAPGLLSAPAATTSPTPAPPTVP